MQTLYRPALRIFSLSLLLLVAGAMSHTAWGQGTRGRRFWLAFMHNGGNNANSTLQLDLSSDVPTTARVIFHLTGDTAVIPLPKPDSIVVVNLNGLFGNQIEMITGEERAMKGFEVIADNDISVTAASLNDQSADAFLCFPEKLLNGHAIVMAYPNGHSGIYIPQGIDQPSEFAVVGVVDGTTLQITLPQGVTINGRTEQSFTVQLNRGEVFFAQATLTEMYDLTGTEIISESPLAVFGGCARSAVPDTGTNYRDFLAEQIPPPEYWGRSAVLIPFYPITPDSPIRTDEARIIPLFDSTAWSLDGVAQPPLRSGSAQIISFAEPAVIAAQKPVLVAQFGHSVATSWGVNGQSPKLGDPSMVIVPPREWFDSAYTFAAITDPWGISRPFDDTAHFVTVVIPTSGTSAFSLDGTKVLRPFTPIVGTDLSYVRIRVAPGSHTAWAAVPFGLTVYGFGPATSYAYVPGMRLRPTPSRVPYDPERPGGARLWLSGANPVRGRAATIGVALDRPASVHLALYDVTGTKLRTLLDRSALPAGSLTVDVDLHDLSPGMYYVRLRTGTEVSLTEKLVIDR